MEGLLISGGAARWMWIKGQLSTIGGKLSTLFQQRKGELSVKRGDKVKFKILASTVHNAHYEVF